MDHVIPRVPVRQWVLSLLILLRLLLAAQPKLVTPVLQVVHRVVTRHLLGQAGLKAEEADSGAVTLIQRFGSAANLNIHLHCLVLDGVYLPHRFRSARRSEGADGARRHAQADGVQAKLRELVVPQEPETPAQSVAPAECEANCVHHRAVRLSWARLLKRVFERDLEHCPNRGGKLKIIAAILEQPVIEKILTHLGLQARAPPRAPARGQALQTA